MIESPLYELNGTVIDLRKIEIVSPYYNEATFGHPAISINGHEIKLTNTYSTRNEIDKIRNDLIDAWMSCIKKEPERPALTDERRLDLQL